MSSCDGLNVALHNVFNTPGKDMPMFWRNRSGVTHDPHPQSSTRPENRVFYLIFKATVDCLTGSHLTLAAQRFQTALKRRIEYVPVQQGLVEMDDLLKFLWPLIAYPTVKAICGASFLKEFPDFV